MSPAELRSWILANRNTRRPASWCLEQTGVDVDTFFEAFIEVCSEYPPEPPSEPRRERAGFRRSEPGVKELRLLSGAEIDDILRRRASGETYQSIGDSYGASTTFIKSVLADPDKYNADTTTHKRLSELLALCEGHVWDFRRDIQPNRSYSISAEDYDMILRLREAGASLTQVERIVGLKIPTILRILEQPERRVRPRGSL